MKIAIGTIEDVLLVDSKIPEFESSETQLEKIESRLCNVTHLILIARIDDQLAGYKIGYEISSKTFYSWLGGVIPKYRRLGIATKLREFQESWAQKSGYTEIEVKSMNKFPSMLQLLISSGYQIHGYDEASSKGSGKILFNKQLA